MRKPNKIFLLYMGGIGVVAAGLRFMNLGKQSLFVDEAFSWLHSQFEILDLLNLLRYLNHPPLYFFLLKIYQVFVPQTEFGLRSLSVIFSLFSLFMASWISYRWWGMRAALFTGWMIALSSFEIYYAQEVRMYTLLSFLWIVSFGLLLEILTGHYQFLILWSLVLVFISQTHIYGLILAFLQSVLMAALWISGIYLRNRSGSIDSDSPSLPGWTWGEVSLRISGHKKWVLVSGVIVFFGILPIVLALLQSTAWQTLGGGVWIPTLKDLPILYTLASVGLVAGRNSFLDGIHLVFPILRTIPMWGWTLFGVILPGFLAIRGIIYAWKAGAKQRWFVLTIFLTSIGPILLVWLLGWFFQTNTWAYKSFLGVVLLFLMLAGIGFSTIRQNWIRGVIVFLTLGIALISLIPYYTIWYKDFSRDAFLSMPNMEQDGIVLLERDYVSPLAHFYLGSDTKVIGLNSAEFPDYPFLVAEFGPKFMYGYDELTCDDLDLDHIQNVWLYGNERVFRERLITMPDCFGDADLWIFEDGEWFRFDL